MSNTIAIREHTHTYNNSAINHHRHILKNYEYIWEDIMEKMIEAYDCGIKLVYLLLLNEWTKQYKYVEVSKIWLKNESFQSNAHRVLIDLYNAIWNNNADPEAIAGNYVRFQDWSWNIITLSKNLREVTYLSSEEFLNAIFWNDTTNYLYLLADKHEQFI